MGVARMLLEAGADVETPDNYGQSPFFMACWKGETEGGLEEEGCGSHLHYWLETC